MQKKLVFGTMIALVLAFSASAQATSIGINLWGSADGVVGTSFSGGYVAQTNWNDWNNGFAAGPVDSAGASVGVTAGIGLAWGGGWDYYYEYGYQCSATKNTLGYQGWCAQYGPMITVNNIPYAEYTVATLVNDGYGLDNLSWQVQTHQTGSTYTTPSYENGGGAMCAIQIIQEGGAPAGVLTGSPVSGSDINFGTVTAYNTGAGPLSATLSNTGPAGCTSITIGSAVITGTDAALFSATGAGATLASGDSTGYTFSFLGAATNGSYSAVATIGTVTYNLKAVVAKPEWPGYLPGDFTEDGEVGPDDFGVLKDNFGKDSLASGNHDSWTLGDANDDGEIGPDDFGILKDNFGRDGGPTALTTAPEPATLALLALAGLAIRRKQR